MLQISNFTLKDTGIQIWGWRRGRKKEKQPTKKPTPNHQNQDHINHKQLQEDAILGFKCTKSEQQEILRYSQEY